MNIISYLGKGISHQQQGKDCQDSLNFKYATETKTGNIILSLADGCSSSLFSKEAAQVATKIIVDIFSRFTVEDLFFNTESKSFDNLKTNFLSQINKSIVAKAIELGESPSSINEFLCTLLFVVIGKENTLVGHIGDGLIYVSDKNLNPIFVSDAENGDDSSHTFFTFLNDTKHFQLTLLPSNGIGHVFMSSDGPYKTLLACDAQDVGVPVKSIFAKAKNNEIFDRETLARYTECMTLNILERSDDWSILLYNADQEQCDDDFPVPVSMATEMYWAYKADNQPKLANQLPVLTVEETPYEELETLEKPVQNDKFEQKTTEEYQEAILEIDNAQENKGDIVSLPKKKSYITIISILLVIAILLGAGCFAYLNKDSIIDKIKPYQATYSSINVKDKTVLDFSKEEYSSTKLGKTQTGELEKDDNYITLTDYSGKKTYYCIKGDYMYNRGSRFNEGIADSSSIIGQKLTNNIELNDGGRLTKYVVKQEFAQDNAVTISVTDKQTLETIYQSVGTYEQNQDILIVSYDTKDMEENPYTSHFNSSSTYIIVGNYVYNDIYQISEQ